MYHVPPSPAPAQRLDHRPRWRRSRRSGVVTGFAMACALCVCADARGQAADDTRAAAAEAARRAKAAALAEPPAPNKIEQAINYVEESRLFARIFSPPRGWFAQIGGLGEGNGFTMGGGYRQPTDVGVFTARALGSFRQSFLGSAEFTRNFLPGESGFVTAAVTRRHEAAQRFYGAGPDTDVDDRTSFGLSATQVDLTAGVRLTSWLTGTAGVGFVDPDITESSESNRVAGPDESFPPDQIPGFTVQPDFVTAQLGLVVDTRRSRNPRRGGLYQAQVRRFSDREGGAYSFSSTRVDLQQFIPFWNESRVLAVRLMTEHAEGLGSAQVPFYVQPTLGGARSLRGYDRQRFRDRSVVLLSAEYRYELNPFLMAAVFYDVGQVAPEWSDFQLKDLRDDYGIGFRVGYGNAVALRADVAFGGEDPVRLIVGFSTSF